MAQAEFHEVLKVNRESLLKVITHYEDYPEFVEGCTGVQVDRQGKEGKGMIRVVYSVNVMSKDFTYTLDHHEDLKTGKVEWHLVDSTLFKKNTGKWEVKSVEDGKTDVHYSLDVEFKIPVPGFILNRLVKSSLPGMIKSFQTKASKLK